MESAYCSEQTTELAKAMLKVQAQLQPALKDRENPFTKSHYTAQSVCRPTLRHGWRYATLRAVHIGTGALPRICAQYPHEPLNSHLSWVLDRVSFTLLRFSAAERKPGGADLIGYIA